MILTYTNNNWSNLDGVVENAEEEPEGEEGDLGEQVLRDIPALAGQSLGHPNLHNFSSSF